MMVRLVPVALGELLVSGALIQECQQKIARLDTYYTKRDNVLQYNTPSHVGVFFLLERNNLYF